MVVRIRRCGFVPCWAPTFPTNVAATVSEPSEIASGSAARRRGAGPNSDLRALPRVKFGIVAGAFEDVLVARRLLHPAGDRTSRMRADQPNRRRCRRRARARVSSSSSAGSSLTTRSSFSREPLRTTAVLGSFGQACTGGPPGFKSSGLMISPACSPSEKTSVSAFCGRSLLPGCSSSAAASTVAEACYQSRER